MWTGHVRKILAEPVCRLGYKRRSKLFQMSIHYPKELPVLPQPRTEPCLKEQGCLKI